MVRRFATTVAHRASMWVNVNRKCQCFVIYGTPTQPARGVYPTAMTCITIGTRIFLLK